jgi:hypothetical protein
VFEISLRYLCLNLLQEAPGKISFTTDVWTDLNMRSFMAVTAHWLEEYTAPGGMKSLRQRVELVGFMRVPLAHTGKHLASLFLQVLDRLSITTKVYILS